MKKDGRTPPSLVAPWLDHGAQGRDSTGPGTAPTKSQSDEAIEARFAELRAISLRSAERLRGRDALTEADLYDEGGLPA